MPHQSVQSLQPDLFHETPDDETLAMVCWTDGLVTAAAVGPEGVETAELLELVLATRAVGRNAPCPCGSGRKYKKCCLR